MAAAAGSLAEVMVSVVGLGSVVAAAGAVEGTGVESVPPTAPAVGGRTVGEAEAAISRLIHCDNIGYELDGEKMNIKKKGQSSEEVSYLLVQRSQKARDGEIAGTCG